MALPGMRSTADFAPNERPTNYRAGILLRTPRNQAPLFALTAAMKSESTNDPLFRWWEEETQMFGFQLGAAMLIGDTTITLNNTTATGATKLKPGDMLIANDTLEAMQVVTVASDTSITVIRAVGAGGSTAGTAAAHANNTRLLYVGSAYREGAPRAIGVSYNPSLKDNVTQIFRDPVEWTRTAMQTNLRTGDAVKEDKRRTLHKHSIGIERAFWMGQRYETLEAGQPKRFTGGLLSFVPGTNIQQVGNGGDGVLDLDELESYFPRIFQYGSSEKVAWGSISTIQKFGTLLRKNAAYEIGAKEKEYGMDVRRIYTPAGTLTLMEHPLFGQDQQFLANDLFIMDTAMLRYRYMQDTIYRKDIQDQGVDGKADEYLTEAGLEVHHGQSFFWLRGINSVRKDD